jgi:putative chitinase
MDVQTFQRASGVSATRAAQWASCVSDAMNEFGIDSPARVAAFIAQTGHESGGFVYTREIWGPTQAQLGYEGRADLGNTQPGDGSKYRGRGLIQVTGRANYTALAEALCVDVVNQPELLEQPDLAARASAWWWKNHGCNEIADRGDFIALTKRINGGLTGLTDRQQRWAVAKAAMGVPESQAQAVSTG